jgi:hypothetical protein
VFTKFLHFPYHSIENKVYTDRKRGVLWAGGIQGVLPKPALNLLEGN